MTEWTIKVYQGGTFDTELTSRWIKDSKQAEEEAIMLAHVMESIPLVTEALLPILVESNEMTMDPEHVTILRQYDPGM